MLPTFTVIARVVRTTTNVNVHTWKPHLVKVRLVLVSLLINFLLDAVPEGLEFWPIVVLLVDLGFFRC